MIDMSLYNLWNFIQSVLRLMLESRTVMTSFAVTSIVVMIYVFMTNHMSLRRLLSYYGLMFLLWIGLEYPRLSWRVESLENISAPASVYISPVYSWGFFTAIAVGFTLGYLLNKFLSVAFGDPWIAAARQLERLSLRLREKSRLNQVSGHTSYASLIQEIKEKAEANAIPKPLDTSNQEKGSTS